MKAAQKKAADQLAAMMPGAVWRPDLYTTEDGDALLGDGTVLVWFHEKRSLRDLGHARIGRGGYVVKAELGA